MIETYNKMHEELLATTSTNEHKRILHKYGDNMFIRKCLYYVYNPYLKYRFSSAAFEKRTKTDMYALSSDGFFSIVEGVANSKGKSHAYYCDMLTFFTNVVYREFSTLVTHILDRSMKNGVNEATIRTVFPDLLPPKFTVALAQPCNDIASLDATEWYVSRKFDGIRCICIFHNDGIRFFTRSGYL